MHCSAVANEKSACLRAPKITNVIQIPLWCINILFLFLIDFIFWFHSLIQHCHSGHVCIILDDGLLVIYWIFVSPLNLFGLLIKKKKKKVKMSKVRYSTSQSSMLIKPQTSVKWFLCLNFISPSQQEAFLPESTVPHCFSISALVCLYLLLYLAHLSERRHMRRCNLVPGPLILVPKWYCLIKIVACSAGCFIWLIAQINTVSLWCQC